MPPTVPRAEELTAAPAWRTVDFLSDLHLDPDHEATVQALARHHSVFFLILRRLRAPLILLIVLFAISVLGLTLAPGPVVDGVAEHMAWLGKDGLYEAVGTAFGVVFRADIDDRTTLNRMTGKIETRPSWTEWRKRCSALLPRQPSSTVTLRPLSSVNAAMSMALPNPCSLILAPHLLLRGRQE